MLLPATSLFTAFFWAVGTVSVLNFEKNSLLSFIEKSYRRKRLFLFTLKTVFGQRSRLFLGGWICCFAFIAYKIIKALHLPLFSFIFGNVFWLISPLFLFWAVWTITLNQILKNLNSKPHYFIVYNFKAAVPNFHAMREFGLFELLAPPLAPSPALYKTFVFSLVCMWSRNGN